MLLVISCPCALVISIPLGYFGGIGGASRRGILVKGANFLDALVNLDTAVFDKTGTLTEGIFEVQRVVPVNGYSVERVLSLAAQAEAHSSHPIAQSIIRATSRLGKPLPGPQITVQAVPQMQAGVKTRESITALGRMPGVQYEEIAGKGVKAKVDGTEILVGSSSLLTENGIDLTFPAADGFTQAFVAADGRLSAPSPSRTA